MRRSAGFHIRLDELKRLSVRSDTRGLLQFGLHFAALGATGALVLVAIGTWWALPAVFLHGYILIFFFCGLHEATHYTPFRSRWLSTLLGHFSGFLLLLPFGYFRLFHWDHHRHTQDPARDPELSRPLPASLAGYLWLVSGLPNWKARITMVSTHALLGRVLQPWVPEEKRGAVVLEARLYLLGYAIALGVSLWLQSAALLWLWILPAMAGQFFLRNYLLAEHTGCDSGPDMMANTRTTYTNAFVRFFAWNMPYHVEHHAYPAIPFHQLANANRLLAPHIQVADPGYIAAMRSILRYLRKPRVPLVN